MCTGGSRPEPQPRLPEAPVMPTTTTGKSEMDMRRRRAASNSGTILTSSSGVTSNAPVQQKTLLGS